MLVSTGRVGIVCLGAFNPAILNHDFLDRMGVLPDGDAPVEVDSESEVPFGEFLATPMVSFIKYRRFHILVAQDRLDVSADPEPDETAALALVAGVVSQYVEVLQYTPIKKYGINVSRRIACDDDREAAAVLARLFVDEQHLAALFGTAPIPESAVLAGTDGGMRWKVNMSLKTGDSPGVQVNVNHEHKFESPVALRETLAKFNLVSERADRVTERILVS